MPPRLFDYRRHSNGLSLSMLADTGREVDEITSTAGVSLSSVIREAMRRGLPPIHRELERELAATDPVASV